MGATSVTGSGHGIGEGPAHLDYNLDNIRKVYINDNGNFLPCIEIVGNKYVLRQQAGLSSSGPIIISGGSVEIDSDTTIVLSGDSVQCDLGGDPRGFKAWDFQCCRFIDSQVASGNYSFIAGGCANTASGTYSHAEGYKNNVGESASPFNYGASHGEGWGNTIRANYAHAEGYVNLIDDFKNGSHVEGQFNIITGDGYFSHVEGSLNTSTGSSSHNEGWGNIVSDFGAHAEGYANIASGYVSHAEGSNTIASGRYSHAEGLLTTASGNYSHAEGYSTLASGPNSHAEGSFTLASAYGSHAGGKLSIANHIGQWSRASEIFAVQGDAQITNVTLMRQTTGITSLTLSLDGAFPVSTNKFNIAIGKAYACMLQIVAKSSSNEACFRRYFLIRNNGGTTSITGAVETIGTDKASAGAAAWAVSVVADNVDDVLKVDVTGAVATIINWVARLETTEVLI